jgi:hypothetical protein
MRRVLLSMVTVVVAVCAGAASPASAAHRWCVGSGPQCFATVQDALDVAQDGDVVRVGRGTFDGGLTIEHSVKLIGADPGSTIVSGGGPVITIACSTPRPSRR